MAPLDFEIQSRPASFRDGVFVVRKGDLRSRLLVSEGLQ